MIFPTGGGQKLLIFLALLDVLSAKVGIGHGHDHQGKLLNSFGLTLTVCKFINFPDTQILREINFDHFTLSNIANLYGFRRLRILTTVHS